jgi:hypothetical protein
MSECDVRTRGTVRARGMTRRLSRRLSVHVNEKASP